MANTFLDPSFENISPPSGWFGNGGTSSTVAIDTEHVHTGTKAMKVFNGGASYACSAGMTAPTAGRYTLSIWAWNSSANPSGVQVRIGGANVAEPKSGPVVDTRDEWVQVSHTVQVTADGSTLSFLIYSPASSTIWVDDVYGGPEIVPPEPEGPPPPLTESLNRLAGTTGLAAQGAANVYAGTTNLSLVDALNSKAGNTSPIALQGVLNQLAGTDGLGIAEAASLI